MNDLIRAIWRDETPYLLVTAVALALLLWRGLASGRATLRHSLLLFGLCLLLDVLAAVFGLRGEPKIAAGLHQAALLGSGVALIRLAGLALFRVLLPALHAQPPRILEDIVVIGGYLLWGMVRLSYAGVELSSLVATSAVITAVVAFAMQDTLGNMLGGLALQLDDSLAIGDWIKVDELSGRVVEIQWRFTAIVTRNGEKVVIPNAQLMKGKFMVVGNQAEGGAGWRRWLWFNIEYAASPARVMAAVAEGTAEAEIDNVARTPAPSCVAMAFEPGSVRYALRYWLIDPRDDDATDSAVRCHLLATVQRNGWRIAMPDQSVHVVPDDQAHRDAVRQRELGRRLRALAGVGLFASLDEAERRKIAERLSFAPFARGDVMTRQGATAHWLYILVAGEAEVWWQAPSGERRLVSRLPPGSIFGEMGLMTGAPRAATVVAASDVECYRLDKASFEDIVRDRQAIAESISQILAQRQHEYGEAQADFRRQQHEPGVHRTDILERMRAFFGLH
ncbi:MAG: mechanosensitive ion channel protein MscS [Leptothrix sp. (in: Bacteria)]|nr:mechanosensitive ion channel protein MscS [Leptothrix sp. (in: b-proteobacteria)]